MTLRNHLVLRYAIIVGVCLVLVAGLAHHEFVVEPRERIALGIPDLPEDEWGEVAEVVIYSMIPIVLGVGWWLMRRTLDPIDDFTRMVEGVNMHNLTEPLSNIDRDNEIGRLTNVFNEMMQRLDMSFRHAREFALHASHELKTPLALMRAEFENIQRDPTCPEFCAACSANRLDEIQRMVWIVDSLTLLTKADLGLIDIERKPVLLADLVCECFEDAQVLGEAHGVSVSLGGCEAAIVYGDRNRLRQMLLNLVDNATKYNRQGGLVTISLRVAGADAEITMSNTGPGIPHELLTKVFQRFVRGTEARERAEDGCGLGLSICQWIVRSHGGTIDIESSLEGMTVVTVRIPCLQ